MTLPFHLATVLPARVLLVTGLLTGMPAPAPVPAAPPGPGIPFGVFGLTGSTLVEPFDVAVQAAQPHTILRDLARARAVGAHVIVNFSGGRSRNSADADGHFSFDVWKGQVDRFIPIAGQLNDYVTDGTLLAFMLIDEPFAKNTWGGQTVPLETLERMASYSKSIFPRLPTAVRAVPSKLRPYPWRSLDLAWAQYEARMGPIEEYAEREADAARATGLGLVVGLNITKGGDGSSGVGEPKGWRMSGSEILRDGRVLLGVESACAFLMWDGRPEVITRPDAASALRELAEAARAHPAVSCGPRRGGAAGTE